MGRGRAQRGRAGERGRSRPGGAAAAEQCGIHVHGARPDRGRGAPADEGISGGWRGGRGLHEHGQRAGHVAVARDEISRCGQGHRRPRGVVARWDALLAEDDAARLDRGVAHRDSQLLPRLHRPGRRGHGDAAGHRAGQESRRRSAIEKVSRGLAGAARRGGKCRSRGTRAGLEREIPRRAGEAAGKHRAIAVARRLARTVAHREARGRAGAARGNRRVAEDAVEIQQHRAHRQGGRTEGVDGTGDAARVQARGAHQTRGPGDGQRHHGVSGRRRRRRWSDGGFCRVAAAAVGFSGASGGVAARCARLCRTTGRAPRACVRRDREGAGRGGRGQCGEGWFRTGRAREKARRGCGRVAGVAGLSRHRSGQ